MAEGPSSSSSTLMVMKRITSSEIVIWRSISATAAGGATMLSSEKCALRFFLMRYCSDLTPQYSVFSIDTAIRLDDALELSGQSLDLLRGDVLAGQEYMLVIRHGLACPLRYQHSPGAKPLVTLQAVEECPRERRHGMTGPRVPAARAQPSVQPPAEAKAGPYSVPGQDASARALEPNGLSREGRGQSPAARYFPVGRS